MHMNETLRIAALVPESIVDGPGIRCALFTQGCPHACPGCHNNLTWDICAGEERSIVDLSREIRSNAHIRAISVSGGEPLCQADALAVLLKPFAQEGYSIWLYTGFVFEDILAYLARSAKPQSAKALLCMEACSVLGLKELLECVDVLIDGPFVEDLYDYMLLYRGSSNQRMLDCKRSIQEKRAILFDTTSQDSDILEAFTKPPSW